MDADEFDPTTLDRGTVVWCRDPFTAARGTESTAGEETTSDQPGRPVVVINTDDHPFAGEQYLCCSLTTRTWYADQLVPVPESAWLDGGTPKESFVIPWSVLSPQPDDLSFWIGQLRPDVLTATIRELLPYVHPEPERLLS